DFYGMKAFFNTVGEQGDGAQDTLMMPSPDIEKKIAPLQKEAAAMQDTLAKLKADDATVRAWADRLAKQRLWWEPCEIVKLSAQQGEPKAASDGRAFELGLINREGRPLVATVKVPAGKKITALRIECSSESDVAGVGLGRVFVQAAKKKVL